ncbi:MAG: XRE family transcriptional regulator [Lachnospiraceae bacterium]|nr:XRE family transcriptional regulator [Lachnospiraceae bacterium]
MQKTTNELMNELTSVTDVEKFLEENQDELLDISLSEYLRQLLQKYGLDKSEIFQRAGMKDNNYGYEIFRSDKKKASREKLIRICIGFPLTIEETQQVLKLGKVSPLYPRDTRDALILYGLKKGYDLNKLNDLLFEKGEDLFE